MNAFTAFWQDVQAAFRAARHTWIVHRASRRFGNPLDTPF